MFIYLYFHSFYFHSSSLYLPLFIFVCTFVCMLFTFIYLYLHLHFIDLPLFISSHFVVVCCFYFRRSVEVLGIGSVDHNKSLKILNRFRQYLRIPAPRKKFCWYLFFFSYFIITYRFCCFLANTTQEKKGLWRTIDLKNVETNKIGVPTR
jgi:hypothetical protein